MEKMFPTGEEEIIHGFTREEAEKVIHYSAIVHDICDKKYVDVHVGLQKIIEALKQEGLSATMRISIATIIQNMSYSDEKKKGYPDHLGKLKTARDIVSDADKIDALGEVGIKRCRQTCLKLFPQMSTEEIEKNVVEHAKEKLVKLMPYFIRTEHGKELAKSGHDVISKFIEDNYQ